MPELPDTDAARVANAVKAATSGGPHPLLAMGVWVEDETITVRTPMQAKLDAFLESTTLTLHVDGAGDVDVPIPFRMRMSEENMRRTDSEAQPFIEREHAVNRRRAEAAAVAVRAGVQSSMVELVFTGRATPHLIQVTTQALIDAGKLPPEPAQDPALRIRTMMTTYGVGLDCAGYVQQAFMASHGLSRSQAGFRPPTDEDLSNLSARGFKRVAPEAARPGDLLILSAPGRGGTGHTAIVRGSRMATEQETSAIARGLVGQSDSNARSLRRVDLDSSWGSAGDPARGGVERVTVWYDHKSRQWITPIESGWIEAPTLHGDPVEGLYRPAQEP